MSISYRFKAVNLSFTVVPIGHEPMPGPLLITYPQSNFDPDPTDPVSMLLHWNPGKQTKCDNIGIIHVFHSLAIAVSQGNCLNMRSLR